MKSADMIDAVRARFNRQDGFVTTRSGKWHPTGSRRKKAWARRERRVGNALQPLMADIWKVGPPLTEAQMVKAWDDMWSRRFPGAEKHP